MSVPVVSGEAGVKLLRQHAARVNKNGKHEVFAFYSSVLGGVTRDPALFQIPVDDHMVTRGHAVFDTANVKLGMCYGLSFHLDRLLDSARKARIDVSRAAWLGSADPAVQKAKLKEIILSTIAVSGKRDDVYVRYWMSAGRGDFAITPSACLEICNFYCVVHANGKPPAPGAPLPRPDDGFIVHEATVSVPLKNQYLATLKSNNYLINALCTMEAQEKTGRPESLGLQIGPDGLIAEFAIGSIGLVGDDGVLRSPKTDRILKSTTVVRAFSLARQQLMPRGILNGAEFSDLTMQDALKANEIIEFGGGTVRAVVRLDGRSVGDGRPGPVVRALRDLLDREQVNSEFVDRVPYERYASSRL